MITNLLNSDMETYSLSLITRFLKNQDSTFEYHDAKVGVSFYHHGCRIDLSPRYKLSVQTHPMIAGPAFAETALQDMIENKIVYDGTLDYDDVKRFHTPEELFEHIQSLKIKS